MCKRDGELLARPHSLYDTDPSGLAIWQKLTVYVSELYASGGTRPITGS